MSLKACDSTLLKVLPIHLEKDPHTQRPYGVAQEVMLELLKSE